MENLQKIMKLQKEPENWGFGEMAIPRTANVFLLKAGTRINTGFAQIFTSIVT